MEPRYTAAEKVTVFKLSNTLTAALFKNVESAGVIQYYHMLIVLGPPNGVVEKYYTSEWSRAMPDVKDTPVFGVFEKDCHRYVSESPGWRDINLFLLHAIELAREEFSIQDSSLNDGELWALNNLFKELNDDLGKGLKPPANPAISRYEARLADYFDKRTMWKKIFSKKIWPR